MKKFEAPMIDVETIEVADIITTSTDNGCGTLDDCHNLGGCPLDF